MSALVRNNVATSGPSDGQPIVFVHGLATDQRIWRFVAPAFEASHRLVLLDLVGSGGSDLDAYDPFVHGSLNGFAEDVLEVCRELALEDVILVGHSAGATISMLAAIEEPDRFSSLVMIGPSPRYLDDDGYRGGFTLEDVETLLDAMERNYGVWCDQAAQLFMGNQERRELSARLAESLRASHPSIVRKVAEVVLYSDHREQLAEVRTPALILQATEEPVAPREVGEYVHERMRDSELVLLRAAGHFPQISAPAEVIAVIHGFLAQRTRSGTSEPSGGAGDAPFGYVATGTDWRVEDVNDTVLAWLDRRRDDVVGRPFADVLTDAGRTFHATYCVPTVAAEGLLREVPIDLERPDGSGMTALMSSETCDRGPNTSPTIRTFLLDAAQRPRYEQSLLEVRRRSEARLRRLQEAAADLAAASTVAEVTEVLPDALKQTFGASQAGLWLIERDVLVAPAGSNNETPPRIPLSDASWAEVAALRISDVVVDPDRSIVAVAVQHENRRLGTLVLEFADADTFGLPERGLLRTLGRQVGQAIERAQLYEQKDRLLSIVSHELRTPLTPIIGFTEHILHRYTDLSDDLRGNLEVVKRNAEQLLVVVDGLLSATRSRHANFEAVPELLRLVPWLSRLVGDYADLEVELIDRDPNAEAWVDPAHLRAVVTNLIANAERYGNPPIVIEVDLQDNTASIVVSDAGEGVPEPFVPNLFDTFTQADVGDTRSSRGLGLGLAIAQDLVARNGGQLHYEPARPRGSRFVVSLPRNQARER